MATKLPVIAASVLLFSFVAPSAHASYVQQGAKLVGTGAVGTLVQQGYSVAVSGDGNTAIVGGSYDNNGEGAAWVYTRIAGVWSQQGAKLVGTGAVGAANQGSSVALSADGNTAIVGGPADSSYAGASWVFTRSAGVWSQQGAKLVGTDAVNRNGVNQGYSVSLSSDGNTALVGGDEDNGAAGAAWVYRRSGGVWSQQGAKLVGTGAVVAANQGSSVALSADGSTAIVGGPVDNLFAGAAWLYTGSGGGWSQQGAKLVGSGAAGNASQGNSVALSADGSTAVVGGYSDNSSAGAAWVFTGSAGVWSQQGTKLVAADAMSPAFQGYSVSVSADGNTAVVGGDRDDSYAGAAWVYTRSAGVWSQQGSKLIGTGAAGAAYQGASVSVSADGNTAVVGGFYDNNGVGAAWVFVNASPTSVNDEGSLVFALERVRPNPTNGSSLNVAFALPSGASARLELMDISGRRVLSREVGSMGVGRHSVNLAGGRKISPGLYWIRLTQGANQRVARVAVIE